MKKLFIPILLVLFIVTTSCNRSKSNSNDIDVETYFISDSVLIDNGYEEDYSRYTMNIDLPVTKNDTLRQNIIQWMLSSDNDDYQAYFKADEKRFFDEEGHEPRSVFEGKYTLKEQTDLYVTYISDGYSYTGGAHPMPWYYGVSFNKADGNTIGYEIFEDPDQLVELISENIRQQYFDYFNTEEEEYLFEPDDFFPLPTNQPWIESDSIVFCYGPFEIAPYAAGMPLCKIAISDLQPYFSEIGKSIFNN